MKVFIVGAGAVASVLAKELAKEEKIERIVCGSNHIENAKKFIKETDKVSIVGINAADTSDVTDKTRGFDLIINASLPLFNRQIMKAALNVGANYQDLDSELLDLENPEQLEFNEEFKLKGAIGLINSGVSPGVTNLFIREACDELDSVDEIKIRALEEQRANEFIFAWSPHVTMDELNAKPLILSNEKFELKKPFTGGEEYEFPGKYGGKRKVYYIYGDEVSTIPKYIKVKNIDYKAGGFDIDFCKILSDAKMFSNEPTEIKGVNISPREFLSNLFGNTVPSPEKMIDLMNKGIIEDGIFISCIECIGKKNGKKKTIRYDMIYPSAKEVLNICPGATYISYATGLAAAIFAKSILLIKERGVFPAEALNKEIRNKIIEDLKKSGVIIKKTVSKNRFFFFF